MLDTITPAPTVADPAPVATRPARDPARAAKRWQRLHRLFARSRALRAMTVGGLARIELGIQGGHKCPDIMSTIKRVRAERESLLSGNEAFMIYSLARAQSRLDGEMAEVGVYQGCSAKLISLAGKPRHLHLFDTFAGLPEPISGERRAMSKGHYAASLDAVKSYLADQPNLAFHQGMFNGTDNPAAGSRFSLVHLDVDLYEGTRECLEFFYPRMVLGGIIVSHDYSYLAGVRAAFDEFLAGRPEIAIELPSSQVMMVKLP